MTETVTQPRQADLPKTTPRKQLNLEPTIQDIISKARRQPVLAPVSAGLAMSLASAVMLWASFAPLDWGPLGWIAIVPLICLVRIPKRTSWMYASLTFGGFAFAIVTLQWMRLGDVTMYTAWFALAAYMSLYFPLFVLLGRTAVHRFDMPLTLSVPVIWVGLEFMRAYLMTGFPWYFLAHTQYQWIGLIQISDLVGAYGVSFLVAMSSACLAIWIPETWLGKLRLHSPCKVIKPAASPDDESAVAPVSWRQDKRVIATFVSLSVVAAALIYGEVRQTSTEFEPGPRVALVQANFPPSVKHDPAAALEILNRHDQLSVLSMKHQPDVIIWPETMFPFPFNEIDQNTTDADLERIMPAGYKPGLEGWKALFATGEAQKRMKDDAIKYNAATIIGAISQVATADGVKTFNSSVFVTPQMGISGRYDKRHRVPFGEYIPLRDELPFLAAFTPFSADFGIAAGQGLSVFDYNGWRFASVICYEDTMPHVVRRIALSCETDKNKPKPVDVLVNQTNDGWFHGSAELDQHLITSAFRAVECRAPMVRAVNGGISSIIDGDGAIVEPEVFINADDPKANSFKTSDGARRRQVNAVLVHSIPLDPRNSLYVRWGDWFAMTCCILTLATAVGFFVKLRSDPSTTSAVTA